MKFINNLTLALSSLTSTVLAHPPHPHPPPVNTNTVTVQLANDHTGANANAKVPATGWPIPIQVIWGNTAVANEGVVSVSSAQLTQFNPETVCKIVRIVPWVDGLFDARKTWVSLDEGKVVNLEQGFIICRE